MTKDNLAKNRLGPEVKEDSAKKGKRKQKERLQERARMAGVIGWEKMTVKKLYNELKRIKDEGKEVPDLREDNSAPESLDKTEFVSSVKEKMIAEEVEIVITDKKTGQTTVSKMKALEALLYKLRQKAVQSNDTREMVLAMREFFDRTLGKPTQEITHSGGIKVEEQKIPSKAQIAGAIAYEKALAEEEDE